MAKPDRTSSDWVTTGDVAQAAGVSKATIDRWSRQGVLPEHKVHSAGARGRVAMWPAEAPQQAVWVRTQLESLRSWEDIGSALAAGEFKPDERARRSNSECFSADNGSASQRTEHSFER